MPQKHIPFLFTTEVGRPEIYSLAGALADGLRALPDEVRLR